MGTQREASLDLPTLTPPTRPSVADQVFRLLQQRILTLELPPMTKMSESDISKRLGVSRQPVREAFKRLERLGFLVIRPQSGTIVSLISEEAILRARFIRTALETQTTRAACEVFDSDDIAALQDLIDQQATAADDNNAQLFHKLDEDFHRAICARSGHDYVWDLIHDHKAHMDRVRMLSLSSRSQKLALQEHVAILAAIASGDSEAAAAEMTRHLSRIETLIEQIKTQNHDWFVDTSA
ncbi:GntR family transcriptional regulator [Paracoccus aurantiacus]|uniref:GntR family transcriptional regulator n=1 Tax=Paracoccus aurantiacus TaxID=2599412 RepID=A0A5C6S4N0_9RHOB|nr:GntR family transcriptional regulator [Paracoccus aurantiacus]